ncbi:hypothetical protein N7445_001007 [Penicillium cf. griseofulvum]|nr:hypothetical protein N7445_001007 [Penicillium cf. griseofulvum]
MSFISTDDAALNRTRDACSVRPGFWQIPVEACATMPGGNMTKVMKDCCNGAPVSTYEDNCGIYCLAKGQDTVKLSHCIGSQNSNEFPIFCNLDSCDSGNFNETACSTSTLSGTATSTPTSTASSAASTSPKRCDYEPSNLQVWLRTDCAPFRFCFYGFYLNDTIHGLMFSSGRIFDILMIFFLEWISGRVRCGHEINM